MGGVKSFCQGCRLNKSGRGGFHVFKSLTFPDIYKQAFAVICILALSFERTLKFLGQGGNDLEEISHDAVRGHFEDGRIGVFVDGHDDF